MMKNVYTHIRMFLIILTLIECDVLTKSTDERRSRKSGGLSRRIIGGQRCGISDHPYVVSIQDLSDIGHVCAGTLIKPQWVLTTRHNVESLCNSSVELKVIAGTEIAHKRYREAMKIKEGIQKSVVEKCYWQTGDPILYDLAMLKLKTPINESDVIKYAMLPFRLPNATEHLEKVCKVAKIAGWGIQYTQNEKGEPLQASNGTVPRYDLQLQCIETTAISQKLCIDLWKNKFVNPSTFCTFKENTNVCHGDGGGPVMCNEYMYGIVSMGRSDCVPSPNHPSIYLRVEFFKDFIQNTIDSETKFEKSAYGQGERWSWRSPKTRSLIRVSKLVPMTLGLYLSGLNVNTNL